MNNFHNFSFICYTYFVRMGDKMFGKVIRIDNNLVTIENLGRKALSSLMNCHIVFEDETRKIVGEIVYIDEEIVKILLVGEIVEGIFV